MKILATFKKTAEETESGLTCPKGLECCTSKPEELCEARLIMDGKLTECLEDNEKDCKFAVDFGFGRFCECRMRTFLLKTLHI